MKKEMKKVTDQMFADQQKAAMQLDWVLFFSTKEERLSFVDGDAALIKDFVNIMAERWERHIAPELKQLKLNNYTYAKKDYDFWLGMQRSRFTLWARAYRELQLFV